MHIFEENVLTLNLPAFCSVQCQGRRNLTSKAKLSKYIRSLKSYDMLIKRSFIDVRFY